MSAQGPESVLRPGSAGWELWRFPSKEGPKVERNPDIKSIASAPRLLLALPTRTLMAIPLWVAEQGDPLELAELELSGRHLIKRDSEVRVIPIDSTDGRSLVLAIAVGDESPAAEYFSKARFFDIPARLFDPGTADVLIWREFGDLVYAFYKNRRCVYFSASGESLPGPAFCGLVLRAALRLRSEQVISGLPSSIRVIGDISSADALAIGSGLRLTVERITPEPPPVIPGQLVEVAPPAALRAIVKRRGARKLALVGVASLVAYLLLAGLLGGGLLAKKIQLDQLNKKAAALAPEADKAKTLMLEWKEFQSAIDPQSFALDQLAAVAAELPGDQVRLTQFALENGRLLLAGEAADIAQAYAFLEKVKKSAVLQSYDWTSRQPQLAGKNKVRFEMEGTRPDAQARNE
jgi:Tfp pilus assembly protein PilN